MKRDFKGIWIDKVICRDTNLKWIEKLFIVEINSLDGKDGCYASNAHFSEFFKLSKSRCTQIIMKLKEKKYLSIEYEYEANAVKLRVLRILNKGIKNSKLPIKNIKLGYLENAEDNNTTLNNTIKRESRALDQKRVEKKFRPPSLDEVREYFILNDLGQTAADSEAHKFLNYYESNGWKVGKNPMKNWKSAAAGWLTRMNNFSQHPLNTNPVSPTKYSLG